MKHEVIWICKGCKFRGYYEDAVSCPHCGRNRKEKEEVDQYGGVRENGIYVEIDEDT